MTEADYGKFEGKWNRNAPVEEMRKAFAGWEPEVETYLRVSESSLHYTKSYAHRGRQCVEECHRMNGDI